MHSAASEFTFETSCTTVLTNEEVLSALLVDSLVDWAVLLSVNSWACRDTMQRVQTDLHAKRCVKLLESVLGLHQFKVAENYTSSVLHHLLEFHGVVLDVLKLRFHGFKTQRLGGNLGAKFRSRLGIHLLMELFDILHLVSPDGKGGERGCLHGGNLQSLHRRAPMRGRGKCTDSAQRGENGDAKLHGDN